MPTTTQANASTISRQLQAAGFLKAEAGKGRVITTYSAGFLASNEVTQEHNPYKRTRVHGKFYKGGYNNIKTGRVFVESIGGTLAAVHNGPSLEKMADTLRGLGYSVKSEPMYAGSSVMRLVVTK